MRVVLLLTPLAKEASKWRLNAFLSLEIWVHEYQKVKYQKVEHSLIASQLRAPSLAAGTAIQRGVLGTPPSWSKSNGEELAWGSFAGRQPAPNSGQLVPQPTEIGGNPVAQADTLGGGVARVVHQHHKSQVGPGGVRGEVGIDIPREYLPLHAGEGGRVHGGIYDVFLKEFEELKS